MSSEDLRSRLLERKARAARAYAHFDARDYDLVALGRRWTAFADSCIQTALAEAWQARRVQRMLDGHVPTRTGLFVLGLGKLGGHDLNYSSDVDLVAFFDSAVCDIPKALGRTEICSRVLRELTRILDKGQDGRFVWRVDWRLRPDPSVTDLAMSAEAGVEYFTFNAAPWRRLAMMKSRIVAGDRSAGERFQRHLSPWIWRRQLDYRALDDISQMKARIKRDHPDLGAERAGDSPLDQLAGFHLKLGDGGIREIEFIVNGLQLLWGGRHPQLRTTHTLTALGRLSALGLLDPDAAEALHAAYIDLRRTENRVQLVADRQEHRLPEYQAAIDAVLAPNQQPALLAHRARVHTAFVGQFAEPEAEATPEEITAEAPETNLELANYIRRPGNGYRLKRLLVAHPQLVEILAQGLDSPLTRTLLEQTPTVLDRFATGQGLDLEQQVAAAEDYEARLEALRAAINEGLFSAYIEVQRDPAQVTTLPSRLNALAERALTSAADLVAAENGHERLPFTILALGKLGMGQMLPGSDLDLIFIGDEGADLDLVNRLSRRLVTALNAPMRNGRAYETDTRLRPSGRAGPPATSFASFRSHHLAQAWSWEHLALVWARPVYGTAEAQPAVATLVAEVLAKPRDLDQFHKDAASMLKRLRDNRADEAKVKSMRGGLMECEYLASVRTILSIPRGDLPLATLRQAVALQRLGVEAPIDAALLARTAAAVETEVLSFLDGNHTEAPVRWA